MTLAQWKQQGMIDALAEVFGQAESARFLLKNAGFPSGRLPPAQRNATIFWDLVCEEIEFGVLKGGFEALRAAARQQFPYHPRFRGDTSASSGRDVPVSSVHATPALSRIEPSASPSGETNHDGRQDDHGGPIPAFISYAHEDREFADELLMHLAVMQRQRLISAWTDRDITAGAEWRGIIDAKLKEARLVLALVSPAFLASDYCYDVEMACARERAARGAARLIPIVLRPCDWLHSPLAEFQALPSHAVPITKYADRDQAFQDVISGLRSTIATLTPVR
jgi:hypothetical protein